MRPFFEPTGGPLWLKQVLTSIRAALGDIWYAPLKLKDYATTDLPTAADFKQGVAYDSTLPALKYSDGTNWVRLSDYDADVAAYAALSTTGIVVRTGAGTAATRTLTGPAAGITVSNGDGVSGNPTLALADDLLAVEGLSGTGLAVRTSASTWTNRTITGTANEITSTNGDGVSGAPTLSLPTALTFTGKTVTGGTFNDGTIDANLLTLSNASENNASGPVFRLTSSNGNANARNWNFINSWDAFGDLTLRYSNAKDGNPAIVADGTTALQYTIGTGLDVLGLARCDTFRIDQTPTAETPAATHTITISANGTNYKILCVAA